MEDLVFTTPTFDCMEYIDISEEDFIKLALPLMSVEEKELRVTLKEINNVYEISYYYCDDANFGFKYKTPDIISPDFGFVWGSYTLRFPIHLFYYFSIFTHSQSPYIPCDDLDIAKKYCPNNGYAAHSNVYIGSYYYNLEDPYSKSWNSPKIKYLGLCISSSMKSVLVKYILRGDFDLAIELCLTVLQNATCEDGLGRGTFQMFTTCKKCWVTMHNSVFLYCENCRTSESEQ